MMNNSRWRSSKFVPLAGLIIVFVVQFIHAQWTLQSYREYARQDNETLRERMREDEVPENIKEHIAFVQTQSTLNASLLINSLSLMQIVVQSTVLIMFFSIYFSKNR